jgi:hypothetical protein
MADLITIRRDTAANWASANPTLADGELAYDRTNLQLKVGDGATPWATLPFSIAQTYANNAFNSAANALTSANNASNSAANAAGSVSSIAAIAASSNIYQTKAAANTALSGLTANAYAQVLLDETRSGKWTIYQKVSGAYVFVTYAMPTFNNWYVDPKNGSDTNAGTIAGPFQTPNAAFSKCQSGDTIYFVPGAVVKYMTSDASGVDQTANCPDYVNIKSMGGKTLWMGFDKVTGTWTSETGAY